jgi:co-chaperonin GroES (HSP10)
VSSLKLKFEAAADALTEKECTEQISFLTQSLYRRSNRVFRPLYPWVLVRVCEREQKVGSIICPDLAQNKTIHEGIVVATWTPFTQETGKEYPADTPSLRRGKGLITGVTVPLPGMVTKTIEKHSKLEIGQHVLFPHWVGMPVKGLDDKHWRVIKEENWDEAKEGGIIGVIDDSPAETKAREQLRSILEEKLRVADNLCTSIEQITALVSAQIEDRFILVDRETKSVTLSGR